ncbi:hypothetical protein RIF29_20147 [Crotalaria pallida]|uniref:Uncharacterized protein n=1 Tax=Crotalaria pallida TaxID=3830 RepID=A0AAN9I4R9_CROPI
MSFSGDAIVLSSDEEVENEKKKTNIISLSHTLICSQHSLTPYHTNLFQFLSRLCSSSLIFNTISSPSSNSFSPILSASARESHLFSLYLRIIRVSSTS